MVSLQSCENLLRVEKIQHPKTSREVTRFLNKPLPAALRENEKDMLAMLAFQRSSRIFFYQRTVLVEGASDCHILTAMFEHILGDSLESKDTCIVDVGSKDKLINFLEILGFLGSDAWAIADLDFMWRGAGAFFKGDADYSNFLQTLSAVVEQDVPGDEADDSVRERRKMRRFELCCATEPHMTRKHELCKRLRTKRVYVLEQGEIEAYAGVGASAKGEYLKTAREITKGDREINHRKEMERLVKNVLTL
jgi:hypothetical protein